MAKLTRPKTDRWFLIILGIMLYTLISQLWGFGSLLPGNWGNINLWLRILACIIAVYGDIWVIRIYLGSITKQKRQLDKLETELKNHNDVKKIVEDILK